MKGRVKAEKDYYFKILSFMLMGQKYFRMK